MPDSGQTARWRCCARLDDPPPAILVSGTIGEEGAVAALRAGAVDFVPKSGLTRLPVAVLRARDDADP